MNNNKIIHIKYTNNLDNIYNKTLFSIGACEFHYMKDHFSYSSIAKSVAKNQNYNFSNFSKKMYFKI